MADKGPSAGVVVRCKACGRLTKSIYPCKFCGGSLHIVSIVRLRWDPDTQLLEEAMNQARLLALDRWMEQAGGPLLTVNRATVIFDIDGLDITVTFYYRQKAHRYPPGQPS